jgi:hypothetical protein
MKRLGVFFVLLVLSLPALAYEPGGLDDVNKTVQASMVVTGVIAVNPDGSVYGYSLDQRSKLPAEVVKLIDQTLPQWEFKPVNVDGKAVRTRARMSLRIVADQAKPKHWVASVKGAQFGVYALQANGVCPPGWCLAYAQVNKPAYPFRLVGAQVAGIVYLTLEVNREGRVVNAAVHQVDLHKVSISSELDRWRRAFAAATLKVVNQWTFHVPTKGSEAGKNDWIFEVPVDFSIHALGGTKIVGSAGYGQWNDYVPGPVRSIPWANPGKAAAASSNNADAIPNNGEPFVPDARFVLLNRLGSGAASSQPTGGSGQG